MPFLTNVAKRRKFINPRFLRKSAVDEFVRRLILIGIVISIKNADEFALQANVGRLYAVSHFIAKRRKISNARKLKFLPLAYFRGRLILIGAVTPIKNADEFALQANIGRLYAVSHFIAKRRKFINPRFLRKSAVDEFVRRLILIGVVTPIKNADEFALSANIVLLYAVSHFIAKRRKISNARKLKFLPLAYFRGRLILIGIVIPIKTLTSLPCRQTSEDCMPFLISLRNGGNSSILDF